MSTTPPAVPIIDVSPFVDGTGDKAPIAEALGRACRDTGFFYVVGHGVSEPLQERLESLSREFFALAEKQKLEIAMSRGGRAWRGYFPVGGELTSGKPDIKEGLYFGAELSADHPGVKSGLPLHGANLFPRAPAALRDTVLDYIDELTRLGHVLMSAIALSLGLEENFFEAHYTRDPLVLFRIFNYPPPESLGAGDEAWGVGEHTDYGVLTILKQDDCGGLEVKTRSGWAEAAPIRGSFVCNLGDMLDRMTGGLYRSTPHRVRNRAGRSRLSFPFFFDPNFHARVKPLPIKGAEPLVDDQHERWDRSSVHAFQGSYGDYLLGKVSKVFPQLQREVLDERKGR